MSYAQIIVHCETLPFNAATYWYSWDGDLAGVVWLRPEDAVRMPWPLLKVQEDSWAHFGSGYIRADVQGSAWRWAYYRCKSLVLPWLRQIEGRLVLTAYVWGWARTEWRYAEPKFRDLCLPAWLQRLKDRAWTATKSKA